MSGSCFLNGKYFSECGKSRRRTELVRLVECQDDMTIHLRTYHLSSDKLSEWQLIVARTGLFNLEKGQTDQMWICPKHRYDLGKGWRKSKTVCQYPKHSGETTRKKLRPRGGTASPFSWQRTYKCFSALLYLLDHVYL